MNDACIVCWFFGVVEIVVHDDERALEGDEWKECCAARLDWEMMQRQPLYAVTQYKDT